MIQRRQQSMESGYSSSKAALERVDGVLCQRLHRLVIMFILVLALCARQTDQRSVLGKSIDGGITTRYYNFTVDYTNVTRLNHSKAMIVVNGRFPGPPIHAREGDTLVINVTNLVASPVTIHWHGAKQMRTCWADGVPYITQCPLHQNQSYTHRFQLVNQTGTLWYHAHISWLRASIHGIIVVRPRKSRTYPFPVPFREIPVMLGEWWNANVEDVLADALAQGGGYNISDALTVNGQPGFLYNASSADAVKVKILPGYTYLLRVVNACLNFGLFFGVANHSLTVVQLDSAYVLPFTVDTILIAPGQTVDALLTANHSSGRFYMASTPFSLPDPTRIPYPTIPATARLDYVNNTHAKTVNMPVFPAHNDSAYRDYFDAFQKSINTTDQALDVPQSITKNLFFTVGYGLDSASSCPPYKTCINGYKKKYRIMGSVNNISFVTPNNTERPLLEYSYLRARGTSVSTSSLNLQFPSRPETAFNYTGTTTPPLSEWFPKYSTRLSVIDFNASVQLILQDTNILTFETHPFHLHGYSFYIVGRGYGNYDPETSPATFNLVDPPLRNTFGVPSGGWLALRFRADNPGVWIFHCHLEIHISWGMEMVFLVREGTGENQTLPPPPSDYPTCNAANSTSSSIILTDNVIPRRTGILQAPH